MNPDSTALKVSPAPNANARQVGGSHYQQQSGLCPHCGGTIQHWDLYALMPYLIGCATKYVTRCILKGGEEDLRKGEHYLQKLRERLYPKPKDEADRSIIVGGVRFVPASIEELAQTVHLDPTVGSYTVVRPGGTGYSEPAGTQRSTT